MTQFNASRYRLALIPIVVTVVAACASAPANNRSLDEARALYQQAASDATVARSAPLELRSAQTALQQSEAALKAGDDVAAVEHYAYLARQRTAVAMQAGQIAQAEKAVAESRSQRDRILIDSRERDAQASRAQADASQALAQAKAAEAEAARKLAEQRLTSVQAEAAKNAQLKAQLEALKAQQTERGMVLTLGDVLFDSGRAELKSGAMRTIDQLAAFLQENAERTVVVEGYTDSVGSDSFNLGLSQRRADSVRLALTGRGIDAARVTARGYGEASPVASNDTAEGRQRNRRIEIVISNPK